MSKVAIIINGDTEARHIENVGRARALAVEMGYEVYVASSERPLDVALDHYTTAQSKDILMLIREVRSRLTQKDEVLIYTTGHGELKNKSAYLVTASPGVIDIFQQLDQLPYNQRTVIMDQCYSGNAAGRFSDDPKTLVIAAGSENETVCCNEIAPTLWAKSSELFAAGADTNRDGIITWRERYAFAYPKIKESHPKYLISPGYRLGGKPVFKPMVTEVTDPAGLEQQLSRLKPGQYAIVTFSASWCGPCQEYKPIFEKMAAESGGAHLFLRTENKSSAKKYNIKGYPTIVIFDHQGNRLVVRQRDAVLAELAAFSIPINQKLQALRRSFGNDDGDVRDSAIWAYGRLADHLDAAGRKLEAAALHAMFKDRDADVRDSAIWAYGRLAGRLDAAERKLGAAALREMFKDRDADVRYDARRAYAKLADHLDAAERKLEASALREIFEDRDADVRLRAIARWVYAKLAK